MPSNFRLFGAEHLAILAMVPIAAALLAAVQRRFPSWSKAIRVSLAMLLLVCTAAYYGSFAVAGERLFPNHVPLELCDASLWLVIASLLTLKPGIYDVAYYWAIAGASMALLTPNLTEPSTFIAVQFFVDHGLIVAAVLYLALTGEARPRVGSIGRAMVALNLYAAAVGVFDFLFKTDYMFLRAKPQAASLLDVLGPWPWYIVVCEGVAFGLFLLLYLPFRRSLELPRSN
jgi:hypothetical integral membrane protein (TIGR02206 family)